MLCFVFAALVVLLDQFFKRWIAIVLSSGGEQVIIKGVISLIYVENTGAAFSILSNQRWLLAGIAFAAAIILGFILLRYTEGFWGTLGLAAVLGGTVGNLTDRIFHGYVIDMFRTLFFPNFAIFNIADIFITLGFLTFSVHFIVSSFKTASLEKAAIEPETEEVEAAGDPYSIYDVPDSRELPDFDDFSDTRVMPAQRSATRPAVSDRPNEVKSELTESFVPEPEQVDKTYPEPQTPDDIASALEALDALESEFGGVGDYDIDALLREYGFEDNNA